jgi:erythronate-4-phosphate dehydrogenase
VSVVVQNIAKMKIVIDDKIPYIKGALEKFTEVIYLPGSKTTPEIVKDADALITRTRTICNEKLLAGSSVKFIATATIGFDHIDTEYCEKAGISWINAPGCNAKSVEQYIAAALFTLALKNRIKLCDKTIGIVGVGNVGSKVARFCEILGMKVLLNDPPRERNEGSEQFVSLDFIRENSDIITFHVPLNMSGEDATFHFIDFEFLSGLRKKPLLINSCRGEVTETMAIINAIKLNTLSGYIADCWENEPDIHQELLGLCDIGTPHIAGYSKDGKANGTMMSVQAVSRFFNLGIDEWRPHGVEVPDNTIIKLDGTRRDEESIIAEAVLETYDIEADDLALRNSPALFEKLRGDYPVRREFTSYTVKPRNVATPVIEKLKQFGFEINLS